MKFVAEICWQSLLHENCNKQFLVRLSFWYDFQNFVLLMILSQQNENACKQMAITSSSGLKKLPKFESLKVWK